MICCGFILDDVCFLEIRQAIYSWISLNFCSLLFIAAVGFLLVSNWLLIFSYVASMYNKVSIPQCFPDHKFCSFEEGGGAFLYWNFYLVMEYAVQQEKESFGSVYKHDKSWISQSWTVLADCITTVEGLLLGALYGSVCVCTECCVKHIIFNHSWFTVLDDITRGTIFLRESCSILQTGVDWKNWMLPEEWRHEERKEEWKKKEKETS